MQTLLETGDDSVYLDQGYKNRADYLSSLAEDHGADLDEVVTLANLLGPGEDFDGLITSIQDWSE